MRELALYFLKLGATGFGGPIALVGYMQRDLVDERHWFTGEDFRRGLALAQVAPGPLAAQLAIYLGWLKGGTAGATIAAIAFVLPSFLMVLALSAAYVAWGGMPWMQGAFYGIGAAVIAIIARSAVKLMRMTLGTDRLAWVLAAISAAVTVATGRELVLVVLACGVVPLLSSRSRRGTVPLTLLLYFAGAGMFVFGSGLAIVPYLHGGVVLEHRWLTERQFLDAVAVSLITPGPVVITVAFIGYLVAGNIGAIAASLGVFLPVWLVTVLVAPHFHRIAGNPRVLAVVHGITAAATGAIAGAAIIIGRRALVDTTAVVICLVTLALPKKIPEPAVIAAVGLGCALLR